MSVNLVYLPYHDWRKILKEGSRTRDAHLIDAFAHHKEIGKLLIINRPITFSELIIKKKTFRLQMEGKIIFKKKFGRMYKVNDRTFVLDMFLPQNLKHILNGRSWYFSAYENKLFLSFFYECLEFLEFENYAALSSNIFSYRFFQSLDGSKIMDAWDNFNLMPGMQHIRTPLEKAYSKLGEVIPIWVTNSQENAIYYRKNFNPKEIHIIKNGVDYGRFQKTYEIPEDLKPIKKNGKRIIGFGGKITHLFDAELFNYLVSKNSDLNFVILGQILDKKVFETINFEENVFYLGDKHYDNYPAYICNLDLGIVPYQINENQHGGDSIKVYEYLAAGLPVVGTRGNGLQDLEEFVNIADSMDSFNDLIKKPVKKKNMNLVNISWDQKATDFIDLIEI